MTTEQRRPAIPFYTGDVLIFVAGIAFALTLFHVESTPPGGTLVGWSRRLGVWDRQPGISTMLWYLLLGPTVSGPVLVWYHRRILTGWASMPARWLWIYLGLATGFEAIFTYADRLWNSSNAWTQLLRLLGMILDIVNPLTIPVVVLIFLLSLTSGRRRHTLKSVNTWLDRVGVSLGLLWMLRSVLQIHTYQLNWTTYFP